MAQRDYERIDKRSLDAEVIFIPIVFGLLFGFICAKGSVYLPSVIAGFLKWQQFLFLKFYLAAIIAALIGGSICNVLGGNAASRFSSSRITDSAGGLAMLIGAVAMGFGMTISAAEPALAFVQVGAGCWNSLYILLGGLLAVAVYGLLYDPVFSRLENTLRFNKNSLDDLFGCEYWHVALPLAALLSVLAYFLETKWASGEAVGPWIPNPKDKVWNIYFAGAVVGLILLPLRMSLFCILDSTYAFISTLCVPVSVIVEKMNCRLPNWIHSHKSTGPLWVLFFFASAMGGAALAAAWGGTMGNEQGRSPGWNLLGGFLLVLGALISGSDSTGMALSGVTDLNMMRTLGAIIIYACGVGAWAVLKAEDVKFESSAAMFLAASA